MSTITIEKRARRWYFLGNTFPVKGQLKEAGAKWDPDAKAWYTGKREVADKFANLPTPKRKEETPDELKHHPLFGKATYKGKTYYIAGREHQGDLSPIESTTKKVKLIATNGAFTFWAAIAEVSVVKRYSGEHVQTIAGIQAFIERQKSAPPKSRDGYSRNDSNPDIRDAFRNGWDGVIGSPSYYSSGAFDEIDQ